MRAGVHQELSALRRSVDTALHLAGIRALARVRAGVPYELAALRRSVATALHLAGIGALARAREFTSVSTSRYTPAPQNLKFKVQLQVELGSCGYQHVLTGSLHLRLYPPPHYVEYMFF